jgi:hypothetical protein
MDTMAPMLQGRVNKARARRVRFGTEVLTLGELVDRAECKSVHDSDGKRTYLVLFDPSGYGECATVPKIVYDSLDIRECGR